MAGQNAIKLLHAGKRLLHVRQLHQGVQETLSRFNFCVQKSLIDVRSHHGSFVIFRQNDGPPETDGRIGLVHLLYAGANPREADTFYRGKVGVDQYGASTSDPADVSTFSHMFGCWETLYVIKQAMEAAGYQGPADKAKLVEATEAMTGWAEGNEHPQGDKTFNGKTHQCFGHQNITQIKNGVAELVYRSTIEEGMYEPETDYTTMAL